ncbi:MAG: hypothetical protein ACNA7N_14990, partial [Yoonia sp.]
MTASVDLAHKDKDQVPRLAAVPRLVGVGIVTLGLLFGAFYLYMLAQPLFGAVLLALAVGVAIVFGANRFYGARFIFPGVAAVLIFIAFPVIYTIYLGFTNYSSFNLLTYERAVSVLTARGTVDPELDFVHFSALRREAQCLCHSGDAVW